MAKQDSEKDNLKVAMLICGAAVLILSISTPLLVSWVLGKSTLAERGQFGDQYGVLNAVFSGLAFAGVVIAILLQGKELMLQREELKLQRAEMKESVKAQQESSKALNEEVQLRRKLNQQQLTLQLYGEWTSLSSEHAFPTLAARMRNSLSSNRNSNTKRTLGSFRPRLAGITGSTSEFKGIEALMGVLSKVYILRTRDFLDESLYEGLFVDVLNDVQREVLQHLHAPNYENDAGLQSILWNVDRLYSEPPWFKES